MILCLNLNPAIDKTLVVRDFEINKIHRPDSVTALAGGKGCNVARALRTLGETPVLTGWLGGFAGQFIENQLHQEGVQTDFIQTENESRACTSILDPDGRTLTEIYEMGATVSLAKVEELRAHIRKIIGNYRAVTLSGSLPPGVPVDFYASVIEIAREANVLPFLDGSGEALRRGAEAGPYFVKPNQTEAESLLGVKPGDSTDFFRMASEITTRYKTNVLLSLGAMGAIVAHGQDVFMIKNPAVEAISPVGSGDCMLAGLVYGILRGDPVEKAVINGVAAGAANTLTIGAGRFALDDFERLRDEVQISIQPQKGPDNRTTRLIQG